MSEDNTSWEIATRGSGRRKGAAQSLIFSNIPGSLKRFDDQHRDLRQG